MKLCLMLCLTIEHHKHTQGRAFFVSFVFTCIVRADLCALRGPYSADLRRDEKLLVVKYGGSRKKVKHLLNEKEKEMNDFFIYS